MCKALITVTTSISLAAGCSREVPARAAETSATSAHVPEAQAPAVTRRSSTSIVGDTFLLVAIGSRSTRVPVSDSTPCGFSPYLRLVISTDSMFYHVTDDKPTCFGPATDSASHWTGLWSTYRVNRDTLHLFQGDGNETFYWVSGILSADSLIDLSGNGYRFMRIRPRSATKAP